jgi:hypothetical protein
MTNEENKKIWKEQVFANRLKRVAPTHVTTCAVDTYLNLDSLYMPWEQNSFP